MRLYRIENGELRELEGKLDRGTLRKVQWIDLCDASDDEIEHVKDVAGIEVSLIDEYEPFQVSSHYSAAGGQLAMTGLLLTFPEKKKPHLLKVTFIRGKSVLVTVSKGNADAMGDLIKECEECFSRKSGRDDIFAAILDMIIDHSDNILDEVGHDLDRVNTMVFQHHTTAARRRLMRNSPRRRNRQLEHVLTELGPSREILVKLRRSVLSFRRMIAFLRENDVPKHLVEKLETFERDLKSISEAEADLSATAGFLLDGVVGYIGLLQNKVMNVLTLVATVMTPSMVIAGIYGMNFKYMPELQWTYGYPFALGLMVATTAGLFIWMRLRGM